MRCGAGPIFKQTHVFLLLFNDPCVRFTIAAAFGNVHGVYKAGNVVLKPEILQDHPIFFSHRTWMKWMKWILFKIKVVPFFSRHDPTQVSGKRYNSD